MFTLNSIPEPISLLDTFQSVIERIAYKLNSLPKYLRLNPNVTTLTDLKNTEIWVTSLLSSIENQNSLLGFSEQELLEIAQLYPQLNLLKDVLEPYIATNLTLKSEACSDNISLCLLSIPQYPGLNKEQIWDNRENVINSLESEKITLKNKVLAQNSRVAKLNSYSDIPHTRFIKEFEKFYFEVPEIPFENVEELFDNLQTTNKVPFINLKNFYKIYHGFIPDPKWLNNKKELSKHLIQLWVNNEKESLIRGVKDPYKKFNEVLLTLESQLMKVTVNMKVDKRHESREDLIQTLLKTLNYEIDISSLHVTDLSSTGYVYYPNETLDGTVWMDLCMNNNLFNTIFAVDESIRLSKIKKNIFMRFLLGRESISLRYNIGQKGDLPEGILDKQQYIRARITNTTDKNIQNLIDVLSRTISAYKVNYNSVVLKYKNYIKNFNPEPLAKPDEKQAKTDTLKDLAPEIFISNYSRVCTNPPIILPDDEAKIQEEQGKSILRFPLYNEGGLDPMNFMCPDDKNPYPGLRANDLANKDTFNALPCCYKKDQRSKVDTKYNDYLKGVKIIKREQTKDVTVTKKILKFGGQGALPKNILNLLQLSVPPTQNFIRRGVSRSPLSTIECILVALNPFATKAQIQELTRQTFSKLQTLNYATAAKQELYNYKPDEILTLMRTKDFRASWYVNTLESFFSDYNITIYIFSDTDDGSLIVPPHFMTYYKLQPKSRVILIYEHYGSDTDNVKYPQSELIIRNYLDSRRSTYIYPKQDDTVNLIFKAFYCLTEKFKFSYQIMPLTIPPLPIQSQKLDSYGKCRLINCDDVSIVVEPLPPFPVQETNSTRRVKFNVALKFIRKYNLPIVEQRKSSTYLKELIIYLGTCKGSLLIKDDLSNLLPDIEITDEVYDIFENDYIANYTPVELFLQQQKFSHVLINNFLYAASMYFATREINKVNLKTFISDVMRINENVSYKSGPRFKSPENVSLDTLSQNLNLTVPNFEIIKRLLYYLQLYRTKQSEKFTTYKNKTFIPNYYMTPSDFIVYDNEYLLFNATSVQDYIQQDKLLKNRYVVPYVEPSKVEPYFFKNNILGERLYLAQNVSSYDQANYVMYYWRFMHRNPGNLPSNYNIPTSTSVDPLDLDINLDEEVIPSSSDDQIPYIAFELYKYVNENQIELLRSDDYKKDKVLAYKVKNKVKYTVLLLE